MRGGRWLPAWTPRRPAAASVVAEVRRVLQGLVPDPTSGATHFHRVGTWVPPWAPGPARRRTFGSHEFYRPFERPGA